MRAREELYSFRELWRQYRVCRRNKRCTRNALAFEIDAEAKLLALSEELRSHRYRPGTSICFITDGAKPREVFAADFRDRIVHHLLVSRYEPVFERRFVHDSYACRKGKGTLAASDALMRMLRRATANGRRLAYALRLDIASFFPSIDKRTLYRILRRAPVGSCRDVRTGSSCRTARLRHIAASAWSSHQRKHSDPRPRLVDRDQLHTRVTGTSISSARHAAYASAAAMSGSSRYG